MLSCLLKEARGPSFYAGEGMILPEVVGGPLKIISGVRAMPNSGELTDEPTLFGITRSRTENPSNCTVHV